MGSEIRIRRGIRSDLERIADFQIRLARETEGLDLDPATVRRGVEAVFADRAKGEYWVAEGDGQVQASLLVLPEWSDWRCQTVLWIHSVYVTPTWRRRGLYRALYSHLRQSVESSSELCGLRLIVDKRNHAAQRVYEQLGMDGDHYQLYEWLKDVKPE